LPAHFRFTQEFQLLLACSSIASNSQERTPAETIVSLGAATINWRAFISLVDRHQVSGLVYAALCRHGAEFVPDSVMEKLKKRKIQVCARALRHAAELARLSAAFAEKGIDAISLKGAGLSHRLFGDAGMRHVRDIDLMVRPEDLGRSGHLLKASGYRCIFPDFDLTPGIEKRILRQDHHHTYWHDRLEVMVELHWRIDHWTPENVSELWQYCETTGWMGTTLQQLDSDALLLFLCSHGAGHRWSCIKWLSDVVALVTRSRNSNWDRLIAMAVRFDLERALAQTAMLMHWLYGIQLAEPLCGLIEKERSTQYLAGKALRVTLMNGRDLLASESFGQLKYLRYTLRLREHLSFPVYLKQVLISSNYLIEFCPPDRLFWLHYPLRPLIWLKRHYSRQRSLF
jgi:Uncharacterised nucleotidyltransferase